MGLFGFIKRNRQDAGKTDVRQVSADKAPAQRINASGVNKSETNQVSVNMNRSDAPMVTSDGIKLSKEQADCVRLLESSSESTFVTGKAGAGKSVILRNFIDRTKKRVAVVAPTGIAAINVSGQTIHSFFGLDSSVQDVEDPKQLEIKHTRLSILACLDALVIDEISMVRADVMDMIDHKLRIAKNNPSVPFGGCQIIAFGDLYQLPPVVDRDDDAKRFLYERYTNLHFFHAPGVQQCPFRIIELQEVHRQHDKEFVDTLNKVRLGDNSATVLQHLNTRVNRNFSGKDCVSLTATNEAARIINEEHIAEIANKLYTFQARIDGTFEPEYDPTDRTLNLKVGAQVIMLKNDPERRWVNGTVGTISELSDDLIRVRIRGGEYSIDQETWTKYSYRLDSQNKKLTKEAVGTFKQFPLRLAYAITIHKSQGQTYDKVMIDYTMGRAFAAGQTYVALSRCRSFEGLYFKDPLYASDIKASQEVIHFMHHESIAPQSEQKKCADITWTQDNRLSIAPPENPRKITGTRLSSVLDKNKWHTPFEMWCEITGVYKKPFTDNPSTIAGKVVEPKQYRYAASKLNSASGTVITPDDRFGPNAKETQNYDFFSENSVFGGMWDYAMQRVDGTISAIFEMKTTKLKNQYYWRRELPEENKLQAALYAWLLDVDDVYMVSSFLSDDDRLHPDNYRCTEENTIINHFKISKRYPDFVESYVKPALKWWAEHIETGISPQYSLSKDHEILEALRLNNTSDH